MKRRETKDESINRDAAIAAATVILEEFAPHCPGGIAEAMHDRLCEIIEAAIESALAVRWRTQAEPSQN